MDKYGLMQSIRQVDRLPLLKCRYVVDTFVTVLRVHLKTKPQGTKLHVPGLGSFWLVTIPARAGRNPRTGAAIGIGSRKRVKFRPDSKLAARLNGF